MDIETRRRIRAYKKALPELRERVIAVALLLAMSASMLTSASFAWLTISRRPEVTGVNTTVAANGNLEIALATSEEKPDESAVGDSSAAEDQTITASNITWGNLVNLSDESYGLQGLTLRPARLNEDYLLDNPLFGAEYTSDGRVEQLNSSFRYTSWMPDENGEYYFGISQALGVRAVSSVVLGTTSGPVRRYLELQAYVNGSNEAAKSAFDAIMSNNGWMDLLAKVMGYHMCAYLEPGNSNYNDKTISYNELAELMKMYNALIEAFEQEAEAMAALMNFQLYALNGGDESKYTDYTGSTILTSLGTKKSDFKKNGTRGLSVPTSNGNAVLTGIEPFLYDYYMMLEDYAKLEEKLALNKGSYAWTTDKLKDVISNMVNIDECEIEINNEPRQRVGTFLANMKANPAGAMDYMDAGCTAIITNGVLYDFCATTGAEMFVSRTNSGKPNGLKVTAGLRVDTMNWDVSADVYATIVSNQEKTNRFGNDMKRANELEFAIDESQMVFKAQDTYALAIDLWVRTNAEGSYLTLEGNVLTQSHEEPAVGKNAISTDVPLYTLSRNTETVDPETNETIVSKTVYELYPGKYEVDEETGYLQAATDNNKWFRADTFREFTLLDKEFPTQKWVTITEVIGYEGENRIWDREDNKNLTVDSTSQGSGSCYVYYADTPEDMARSLELLKAMHVAFIDSNGNLLANSYMDTANCFEDSGRVTVPLKLDEESLELGDAENSIRAITLLEKNRPLRITALVYLDGTLLTNENVLSAAEIQGQLNIQFGSSSELAAISNEPLEMAERSVTAAVTKAKFDYDSGDDLTTTVQIAVSGDQPTNVKAFFIRKINDAQGSREPTMENFVLNEATGVWECNYTFSAPGNYILRTVQLDGQEYLLKNTPEVEVEGFSITSLNFSGKNIEIEGRNITVMTANTSATVDLNLRFGSSDPAKMPSVVQGRFLRSDGTAVNVNFTYNANTGLWSGDAHFLASGAYDFQYVVLDGKYTELPEGMPIHADISLGMKVAVYNDLPSKLIKFDPEKMTDDQKLLKMYVDIMDGSGAKMNVTSDAKLYYKLDGEPNTLDTNLTWDPVKEQYYGELKLFEAAGSENPALGRWMFQYVKVGSNTITNATTAPEFRLSYPASPEFSGVGSKEMQFVPSGSGAKMAAYLKFSAGTTPMARIRFTPAGGSPVDYYVIGTRGSSNADTGAIEWLFSLPNENGKIDGYWSMVDLLVWNYVDEYENGIVATLKVGENEWNYDAGSYIRANNLAVEGSYAQFTDALTEANYTVKVVQTAYVDFASPDLGNADRTLSGTFLQTQTLGKTDSYDTRVKLRIYDFENQPIAVNTDSIKLTYQYFGGSEENGFYTMTGAKTDPFELTFEKFSDEGNDGMTYIQKNTKNVQYAGEYKATKLTFNIGNATSTYEDDTLPGGIPKYMVTSTKPTVTVTGTNPAPGTTKRVYSVKNPTRTDQAVTGDFFRYTESSATVYIHTPIQGSGDWVDNEAAEAYAPKVSLKLTGVPSGYTSATMEFKTNHADSNDSLFQFNSAGTATAEVGKAVTGVRGTLGVDDYPECYPAGRMVQNQVTLVYNGVTFVTDLTNEIVLDNPIAPTVLKFTNIPDSYTGELPAQAQGEGSSVTVYLPELVWTARIEKPLSSNWSPYTSVGEVMNGSNPVGRVYSHKFWQTDGLCGKEDHNEYQYYVWTKFESSITAETEIYQQGKRISTWMINGKPYTAGQTVTVSGEGILNAVAVITNTTPETHVETIEQVTTKTLYGYVKGDVATSSPVGEMIGSGIIKDQNGTHYSVAIAVPSSADAATNKVGTNMTTDSQAYDQYWP